MHGLVLEFLVIFHWWRRLLKFDSWFSKSGHQKLKETHIGVFMMLVTW